MKGIQIDVSTKHTRARLDYIRGEIEKECVSYGELSELYSLREYIPHDDVLLREWAGFAEDPIVPVP